MSGGLTAWWVEDGGEIRVWWPAGEASPEVVDSDGDSPTARTLLVRLSVEPIDDSRRDLADELTSRWLTAPGRDGFGTLDLGSGEGLVERVRSWRQELSEQVGAHELTVSAWDMDHPHDVRLFTPDLFPLREPDELLQPRDPMMRWLPRDGRCMFCRDGTPLRLVGYRTLEPDPDLADAGIRTLLWAANDRHLHVMPGDHRRSAPTCERNKGRPLRDRWQSDGWSGDLRHAALHDVRANRR